MFLVSSAGLIPSHNFCVDRANTQKWFKSNFPLHSFLLLLPSHLSLHFPSVTVSMELNLVLTSPYNPGPIVINTISRFLFLRIHPRSKYTSMTEIYYFWSSIITSSNTGNPERREYADASGFEVRDLLTGQNGVLTSLENQDDQAHDFVPCWKCRPHNKPPQRPDFGPRPVVPHHKPVRSEVWVHLLQLCLSKVSDSLQCSVAREYAEFDDMFEREPSEDVESK